MQKNKEILKELMQISPLLANIPRVNIQSVPEEYFDKLEFRICINSLLHQNDTKEYFKKEKPGVPAEYFDKLSNSILARIKEDNNSAQEENFPVLEGLRDKKTYTVPQEYFEDLSNNIIAKTSGKEIAKVVSIGAGKWWKYAAAALIAGLMMISMFYIFHFGGSQVSPYVSASQQYKTPAELEKGMASLKVDDIVNYLELHGNITDNELLLEGINTDELPAEMDYLLDDNTLNEYLDKLNINQH